MSFRAAIAFLFLGIFAPVAHAQSWYYTGNRSCMDFGNGISQCFSQGFVSQMSDSQPRSYAGVQRAFQTGQQAGEGVGTLIGVLVGLWIQHHQTIKTESNDLHAQLIALQQAQNDAFQSQLQMEEEDERLCNELTQLDSVRSEHWKEGAANSHEMQATMRKLYEQVQTVEAMERKVKSPKAIRQLIDNPQHGAKWRLNYQRQWASQIYVIHEFLVARVGMSAPQPSTATSPQSFAANDSSVPQGAATVTVERTNANAEIYLDGAFVGNTPAVLHLAAGNHTIRLTAGSEQWERILMVSGGADLRLRPAL